MQLKQCEKGHFYDQTIHTSCPYCEQGQTVGKTNFVDNGFGKTEPVNVESGGFTGADISGRTGQVNSNPDDGRTVVVIKQELGINPVVGWLVCIEGSEKGKDYRIYSDNNYIGRDSKMDICIRGDETISRINHAVISYDLDNNMFYCGSLTGASMVKLNNIPIYNTQPIRAYDRIKIGKTTLLFVPLCGEVFSWT